jgi:hypothetical protein
MVTNDIDAISHGAPGRSVDVTSPTTNRRSGDADMHKGAIEDDHPFAMSNAPGLDDDGLPNDEIAIAEDAIGAREDGSQG